MTKHQQIEAQSKAIVKIDAICNNNCKFCHSRQRLSPTRKSIHLNKNITLLLQQAKAHNINMIIISGGEPFISPYCKTIAEKILSSGFEIGFATNGRALSTKGTRAFLNHLGNVYLHISLHGLDAATHESLTQTPGSFEQTIKGIQAITDQNRHYVHINWVVTKTNVHQLPEVSQAFHYLGFNRFTATFPSLKNLNKKKARDCFPHISNSKPYLNKYLASTQDYHDTYFVGDVPICFFPENQARIDSMPLFNVHYSSDIGGAAFYDTHPHQSMYGHSCQTCIFRFTRCPGIETRYHEYFESDNLTFIPTEKTSSHISHEPITTWLYTVEDQSNSPIQGIPVHIGKIIQQYKKDKNTFSHIFEPSIALQPTQKASSLRCSFALPHYQQRKTILHHWLDDYFASLLHEQNNTVQQQLITLASNHTAVEQVLIGFDYGDNHTRHKLYLQLVNHHQSAKQALLDALELPFTGNDTLSIEHLHMLCWDFFDTKQPTLKLYFSLNHLDMGQIMKTFSCPNCFLSSDHIKKPIIDILGIVKIGSTRNYKENNQITYDDIVTIDFSLYKNEILFEDVLNYLKHSKLDHQYTSLSSISKLNPIAGRLSQSVNNPSELNFYYYLPEV